VGKYGGTTVNGSRNRNAELHFPKGKAAREDRHWGTGAVASL